jgi:hypothetical protein
MGLREIELECLGTIAAAIYIQKHRLIENGISCHDIHIEFHETVSGIRNLTAGALKCHMPRKVG